MRQDIKRAIKVVKEADKSFNACSAYETEDQIILIDNEVGMPPYIVDKQTFDVRQIEFGNKEDMEVVYKTSELVEIIKKDDK